MVLHLFISNIMQSLKTVGCWLLNKIPFKVLYLMFKAIRKPIKTVRMSEYTLIIAIYQPTRQLFLLNLLTFLYYFCAVHLKDALDCTAFKCNMLCYIKCVFSNGINSLIFNRAFLTKQQQNTYKD